MMVIADIPLFAGQTPDCGNDAGRHRPLFSRWTPAALNFGTTSVEGNCRPRLGLGFLPDPAKQVGPQETEHGQGISIGLPMLC